MRVCSFLQSIQGYWFQREKSKGCDVAVASYLLNFHRMTDDDAKIVAGILPAIFEPT
jgi:hypothetical protein